MVLPAALTAKLLKRGIIATQNKQAREKNAANYRGVDGCPNKYNVHHDCTQYCNTHWKGVMVPDAVYMRRKKKMLRKYPLPLKWKEVYDRGTGRHYYWDKITDLVSWLPPKHPKAKISDAVSKLRENRHERKSNDDDKPGATTDDDKKKRNRPRERERERTRRFDDRINRKRARRDEPVDPMDPSAYSDIPRGGWSDGLDNQDNAKTGADPTAAGPLYQQRPYPAPGAVLAANAKTKPTKDK